MSIAFSVITCSHNPRPQYLEQVLQALEAQTLPKDQWEYLLVDNASTEALSESVDLSWHSDARHVREDKLGLTHARLKGIAESTAEVLVFVDDDNVLDADFLEQALKISEEWPRLGTWGGQTRPGFDAQPPDWTRKYWSRLVIREFDSDRWSNGPADADAMPCGAGMCVRRSVANYYLRLHETGQRNVMMDREGSSLMSGGDSDMAICACDLGMGMGLFASLKLTHLIPPDRLTEDYLVKLVEGLACSSLVLNSFRAAATNGQSSERRFTSSVADVARLLTRNRRDRRFFLAVKRGEQRAASLLKGQI